MTFRTRLFLTSLGSAAVTLLTATLLLSWTLRRDTSDRIEESLATEARLAAELLAGRRRIAGDELDASADSLGHLVTARVTFIAPDGRVVGDSHIAPADLAAVENHLDRPEVQGAAATGVGISRRYSTTVGSDMLYVAAPVTNAEIPEIAFVRLALPLTDVQEQLGVVRRVALASLLMGLATAAGLTWFTAGMLTRRLQAIAEAAGRYAAGDFSRPTREHGSDEIGTVARVLDESVRQLGQRAADRALLEAILSGMIEGVLVVQTDGRLQLVNHAARRMLRVTDRPEGRHYLEIIRHPEIATQLTHALDGDTPEARELRLPLEPAATLIARSAPVVAGPTRGAVLVLHDISDLRRADQIRRDFVANVSHELRTPLTAVRGYVEALLEGDSDPEQTRRFMETIARHTLRMERLVRDLLRLARLDAGQEALDRVPCSLAAMFAAVEADLEDAIELRGLRIVRDVAPDASTVSADAAKLHDALRNLLENATNYSPEGGTITLSARAVDGRIVITVADEGPGIPEADLGRVFERFYRVDKSRTRERRDPGGTGLGLAIVKHLVELHGGEVAAANRPTGGALMTLALPRG